VLISTFFLIRKYKKEAALLQSKRQKEDLIIRKMEMDLEDRERNTP
jgi:hypothetical protein